ncbi:LysR family transcriptional regulator [Litoreibacter albidus]|uniref:DNA-binding transcriptional regulator, LysR family n=1 Tax=Litoreibacter albidus TaxID=670155 RepID=A0A1H2ZK91_9RHOB|nr:LysR family transcriptional regulator [Litoreibacter albidus]SDX17757.1 DNA-binding transcriptional regulator, LysR family [Litoreibacter albidus]
MQQDLKPVRVFLEVARLQSFSAAAKSLQMTPASITRIVARLEENFGQQLLIRTTRQVSLTSTGALVAARYQPLVDAFDRVKLDLDREMQPYRGRLSVNAPMSLGLRLMPELVDSFKLAYPNIDLDIRLTDRLVDIVSEVCDLAIRVSSPPTDKSTIWRKLCEVPLTAVAAPSLFDRHPRPKTPDALDQNLCMSYGDSNEPEVWRFHKDGVKRAITTGTSIHSNSGDLLYRLACKGTGIAVLPEFHVRDGITNGDVEVVLPDWHLPPLWLSLYYPPYEALPPLVATFTDFFEAYLADERGFNFAK